MNVPKPVSDERLREIERLAEDAVDPDCTLRQAKSAREAIVERHLNDIVEICSELRCWRETYGED